MKEFFKEWGLHIAILIAAIIISQSFGHAASTPTDFSAKFERMRTQVEHLDSMIFKPQVTEAK